MSKHNTKTSSALRRLNIAMLSVHSSPTGDLGTRDTGGMSVYIQELSRALGRLGHKVDIFTRQQRVRQPEETRLYENVSLVHLPAGRSSLVPKRALYPHLSDFFCSLEKFRASRSLQYDVVHSHYWLSGCVGDVAHNSWGVPHLVTFHTLGALKTLHAQGTREPRLRIAMENALVRSSTRIVVAARRERENLIRHYAAPPEKVAVVPCGVNLGTFRPVPRLAARRKLGLDPDCPIVLFVGRFDPLKGIDRVLAATAELKKRHRLKLVIIGGDGAREPEARKLRALTAALEIADQVIFAGRIAQRDLPLYYSAADVLAIASCYESFGMVCLEALACGTPVVATPVGAMENILRTKEAGCVVSPSPTPRALASGLEKYLGRGRRTNPAKVRAAALGYNWAAVASAIVDEYLSAGALQVPAEGNTALQQYGFPV